MHSMKTLRLIFLSQLLWFMVFSLSIHPLMDTQADPMFDCVESWCSEHESAAISSTHWFQSLWLHTQKCNCWILDSLMVTIFRKCHTVFHNGCPNLYSCQHSVSVCFSVFLWPTLLNRCEVLCHYAFVFSLIINHIECFFHKHFITYILILGNVSLNSLLILNWVHCFLVIQLFEFFMYSVH